jgi:hypothetical protein
VSTALVAALSWEPQIKGALYVIIAITILCGSCYMLLATNMGARLGILLAAAGFFGWLFTLGMVWWVYARGPVGPDPSWTSAGIATGNLASSGNKALHGFPKGWKKLAADDKEVADATPAVDGVLASKDTASNAPFKSANDFVIVGAYRKGGQSHGPFGLKLPRPFDLWHNPHYLAVQVQRVLPPPPGQVSSKTPDPSAPQVSGILLRNLGAKRLHPAVFTFATGILFGLVCYQLHVRDKEAAARREREAAGATGSGRLQPVPR